MSTLVTSEQSILPSPALLTVAVVGAVAVGGFVLYETLTKGVGDVTEKGVEKVLDTAGAIGDGIISGVWDSILGDSFNEKHCRTALVVKTASEGVGILLAGGVKRLRKNMWQCDVIDGKKILADLAGSNNNVQTNDSRLFYSEPVNGSKPYDTLDLGEWQGLDKNFPQPTLHIKNAASMKKIKTQYSKLWKKTQKHPHAGLSILDETSGAARTHTPPKHMSGAALRRARREARRRRKKGVPMTVAGSGPGTKFGGARRP